jgi:hypothetical protein
MIQLDTVRAVVSRIKALPLDFVIEDLAYRIAPVEFWKVLRIEEI